MSHGSGSSPVPFAIFKSMPSLQAVACVPWESQRVNTCPENLGWTRDSTSIQVHILRACKASELVITRHRNSSSQVRQLCMAGSLDLHCGSPPCAGLFTWPLRRFLRLLLFVRPHGHRGGQLDARLLSHGLAPTLAPRRAPFLFSLLLLTCLCARFPLWLSCSCDNLIRSLVAPLPFGWHQHGAAADCAGVRICGACISCSFFLVACLQVSWQHALPARPSTISSPCRPMRSSRFTSTRMAPRCLAASSAASRVSFSHEPAPVPFPVSPVTLTSLPPN